MPRRLLVTSALFAFAATLPAQTMWQLDDDRPRRPDRDKPDATQDATPPPLSPNLILGRVVWVDTPKRLAVLELDRVPSDTSLRLVGRDLDCTPRAVLRQIPLAKRTRTVACRVTHGAVKPGMEIVLPAAPLLARASAELPAHETPAKAQPSTPAPAAVPPSAPVANSASAAQPVKH